MTVATYEVEKQFLKEDTKLRRSVKLNVLGLENRGA